MLNISIDYLLPAEKWIQTSLVPKRNLFFLNLHCCQISQSNGKFSCIWLLFSERFGFCGDNLAERFCRSRYVFVQLTTLDPASYPKCSSCSSLTPTHFAISAKHLDCLTSFLLHPQLRKSIINIPFLYSVMEFVYLFYFSKFWTKIFVSFCRNVHTVNVC